MVEVAPGVVDDVDRQKSQGERAVREAEGQKKREQRNHETQGGKVAQARISPVVFVTLLENTKPKKNGGGH